jgi:hypothetical protein
MALTLVAERREPSGESSENKAETVGLAPLRYSADSKVSVIGWMRPFRFRYNNTMREIAPSKKVHRC